MAKKKRGGRTRVFRVSVYDMTRFDYLVMARGPRDAQRRVEGSLDLTEFKRETVDAEWEVENVEEVTGG